MTPIPDLLIPLDITDAWIDMHMGGQPSPRWQRPEPWLAPG